MWQHILKGCTDCFACYTSRSTDVQAAGRSSLEPGGAAYHVEVAPGVTFTKPESATAKGDPVVAESPTTTTM